MMKALKQFGWAFFLLLTIVSFVSASDFGPKSRGGRTRPQGTPPTSVAEPAAIALLGAGLVSLVVYAKKKRGKKQ